MAKATQATGAIAAAAWGLTRQGVLAQIAAIRFAETAPSQDAAAARQHVQLLLEVLHSGQERVHRADAKDEPLSRGQNVLLAPLVRQGQCVGVLEVFLHAETADEELAQRLAALVNLSHSGVRQLEGRSLSRLDARGDAFQRSLLPFIQRLHRDLRVGSVALTTVNEGRLLLGCERVSLVLVRGSKTKVLAVSGQDRVRDRSKLIRLMKELAALVRRAGQPLHYDGNLEVVPPPAQGPLVAYLAESGAARLTALPLYAPPPIAVEQAEASESREAFGVLVMEWFSGTEAGVPADHQEAVAAHAAQALHNALVHEGAFLAPLWRAFNRPLCASERAARRRRGIYAACACIGLALLLLLPVPYYVHAEGELLPVIHIGIFAPEDGEVVEVSVRGGERIEKGQLLMRLGNDALAAEHLQVQNHANEMERSLAALFAQRGKAVENGAREAAIRLEGRIAQTQLEVDGTRKRLAALERELARLEVRSLVSGTVATFQPAKLLLHRPVRRGELLLEIMDESGPWKLELEIPAHRVGHVLKARGDGKPKLAASVTGDDGQLRLAVRFTLATMPEQTFDGVVHRLATKMDTAQNGESVLIAHAALDAAEVPVRTCGTEVFARLYCGRERFAYWLFGDAVDFVRQRMW